MNHQRLANVIEYMRRENLQQILISSTASVYYLTGLWIEPHERMLALYLDRDGRAVLFGNEIFGVQPDGLEWRPHKDGDDPVADLAAFLWPGRMGIDKAWPSCFLIGLMNHRNDITPVPGSAPVDMARRFKDAEEQAAMRRASAINDQVVEAAITAIREGVSELELASLVNREFAARGADVADGPQLVCFGANAADPHHAPGADILRKGAGVTFDIFTPIGRYWCDMTRTVFFGGINEEQRRVYEMVLRANLAGIDAVKPGVPLSQIDRAARRIIEDAGYGPYFTHRLGHNIGLDCHEPPDVSSASQAVAQPGMVFSIEPGIYLPGRVGVRIEDLVLVTETGCEVLNKASKDLRVIE